MIPLKIHNIIDYVAGAFLILAPVIFGFSSVAAARNVFMVSGILLVLYSLFTNYQYAVLRVIPLGLHMVFDAALGALVISAPWILVYRGELSPAQEYLHYISGIAVLGLVAMTAERTEEEKRAHGLHMKTHAPLGVR